MEEHKLYSIQDPSDSIRGLPVGTRVKTINTFNALDMYEQITLPVYTHTVGCDCVCSLWGP